MARMKIKNSDIFPVPNNAHMMHLGTISMGLREFIVIVNTKTQKCYIEEVVLTTVDFTKDIFANCKFIADDHLAEDLARFAESQGLLNIAERMNQNIMILH